MPRVPMRLHGATLTRHEAKSFSSTWPTRVLVELRRALESAQVGVEVCRLDRGKSLPGDPHEIRPPDRDGGPMGVHRLSSPNFAYLRAELELMRKARESELPVIGICLGAQLLAHLISARVAPNQRGEPPVRVREVGFGALSLHHDADTLGLLSGLHDARGHGALARRFLRAPGWCRVAGVDAPLPPSNVPTRSLCGNAVSSELDEQDIEALLEADAYYVRETLGVTGAEHRASRQRALSAGLLARQRPTAREPGARARGQRHHLNSTEVSERSS